jgi:hypothetical protein
MGLRAAACARAALVACLIASAQACGGSDAVRAEPTPADRWRPALRHLLPRDLDLLVRLDWAKVRHEQLETRVLSWLDAAGLSQQVRVALEGCLSRADTLLLGGRLGPRGLDGDLVAVFEGGGGSLGGAIPCGVRGWRRGDPHGVFEVFEPREPVSSRGSPALLIRSTEQAVLLATPGQIDALLRVLREGPDADRLEPSEDALASVDARMRHDVLPQFWREQSPNLASLFDGTVRLRGAVHVGEQVQCKLSVSYANAERAEAAGNLLREIRAALLASDREAIRQAAKDAHATLQGEVLVVTLSIPR